MIIHQPATFFTQIISQAAQLTTKAFNFMKEYRKEEIDEEEKMFLKMKEVMEKAGYAGDPEDFDFEKYMMEKITCVSKPMTGEPYECGHLDRKCDVPNIKRIVEPPITTDSDCYPLVGTTKSTARKSGSDSDVSDPKPSDGAWREYMKQGRGEKDSDDEWEYAAQLPDISERINAVYDPRAPGPEDDCGEFLDLDEISYYSNGGNGKCYFAGVVI